MSKRWTDHEIKSLTQYVTDGKTDAETASLLGRSEGGVKYKKQALGLAVKKGDPVQIDQLVRASVIQPNHSFRRNKNTIQIPDETKLYGFQRIKLEDLNDLPRSRAINYLIKTNDSLKFAVDTYVDYTVADFVIDAVDEGDYQIISNWIHGFPKGRAGFLKYLKQLAYGRYVEGGIASEAVSNTQGMPIKAVYVSPWTIAAELREDDEIGEYYVYGQRQYGKEQLTVLYDEANPQNEVNPGQFIYLPAHQNGDDPFGSSQVGPALFSVSSMQNLLSDIVNFMQGKVFPKHVYSIDVMALSQAGYTPAQIAQAQQLATDLLKNTLDGADITEDVILSIPIIATLIGSTERARLDGLEMIIDIFERQQQRGLKIPRVIYGSRRTGGASLNSDETRIEWFSFFKRIFAGMADIEAVVRYHCDDLLMMHGSTGTGGILLDRTDPEMQRYAAEQFKMDLEGFTALAAMQSANGLPLFTAAELRRKVIQSQPMLNDLDLDYPTQDFMKEMEMKREMMPMPMMQPAESEGNESDEGTEV